MSYFNYSVDYDDNVPDVINKLVNENQSIDWPFWNFFPLQIVEQEELHGWSPDAAYRVKHQ